MGTEAFEYYLRRRLAARRRAGGWPAAPPAARRAAICPGLAAGSTTARIADARFDAEGCAAARAAGAAVAELVEGREVLDAARSARAGSSDALGGLSPQGRHAAELAADALHRALTAAIALGRGARRRADGAAAASASSSR